MKTIKISDEEFIREDKKLLPFSEHVASMAGYIDKRVGFTTKLLSYHYDILSHNYIFKVERY